METVVTKSAMLSLLLCPLILNVERAEAQEQDVEAGDPMASNSEVGAQAIVVTATRREEDLQDVPVAVSAVSDEALTIAGVEQVRNLNLVAPGFNGGRNQLVMQPSIRGVGSSGTSVGDESNVAVYVDGVYQGDPYSTQVDLVEVSRVEVLRGPQGTVFGRNATGGLVNVVTPDPQFTPRARFRASWGRMREDSNKFDIQAYATGGLTDTIAADLAVLYRNQGGYVTYLPDGGTVGETEIASIRSKLLFEPSSDVQFILTVGYVDTQDENAATARPVGDNTLAANIEGVLLPESPWEASNVTFGIPGRSDFNRLDIALKGLIDLDGVLLESTSSYMRTRVHQIGDSDATNILLGETNMRVKPDTFTQELRLISDNSSSLSWTTGVYYYQLEGEQPLILINRRDVTQPITPLTLEPEVDNSSIAGFVEGTYDLTPSLSITLGGRYTLETRKFSQRINGVQLFTDAEEDFDKFTYRAAIQYEVSPFLNIYATYGNGFKSGTFNTFSPSNVAVQPETIEAIEFGIKADPLPWLRANLATYFYNYDNLQVTARAADNSFVLQNAASAEIYGGELELFVDPVPGLNLRAALAYAHSEYVDFPNAQVFLPQPGGGNLVSTADASGNQLVRAPEFTLTLNGRYTFDAWEGEAFVGGNLFHSSSVYYDYLNIFEQEPYQLLTAEIGWTNPDDDFTFRIYGKNLTNEAVVQQISPGPLAAYATYERPREIGASLEVRF